MRAALAFWMPTYTLSASFKAVSSLPVLSARLGLRQGAVTTTTTTRRRTAPVCMARLRTNEVTLEDDVTLRVRASEMTSHTLVTFPLTGEPTLDLVIVTLA